MSDNKAPLAICKVCNRPIYTRDYTMDNKGRCTCKKCQRGK